MKETFSGDLKVALSVRRLLRRSSWACVALQLIVLTLLISCPAALARNAYLANYAAGTVAAIDITTNQLSGAPIPLGASTDPRAIAITPDGRTAYIANEGPDTVVAIDIATNQLIGTPIPLGAGADPVAIAITPDGKTAYVVNVGLDTVSAFSTATNQVIGAPIPLGASTDPRAIAITPDGKTAYVANFASSTVAAISTGTNQVTGAPIPLGGAANPRAIAITPDGKTAYVANYGTDTVAAIDTATHQPIGTSISLGVGANPFAIAITPDGTAAYVANEGTDDVKVISTGTNQAIGAIALGTSTDPVAVAITPDGKTAYVANATPDNVKAISTATNQVVGAPIPLGAGAAPHAIAIVPDQSPTAALSAHRARPGLPVTFDASASRDPDGTIATYAWSFGDGTAATSSSPTQSHTFAMPGTYAVVLSLTDDEGCQGSLTFTGQTAHCNASSLSKATQVITVAFPGVAVKCPRAAKPEGCGVKLQAIARKPRKGKKAKAESALAKVKLRPGKKAIVSIKPKAAFRAKLAAAETILLRRIVTIAGSTKTRFVRSKVLR